VGLHGFGAIAQSLVELMSPIDPIVTADTGVPDDMLSPYGVIRAASIDAPVCRIRCADRTQTADRLKRGWAGEARE